jgi:hypothetical protein
MRVLALLAALLVLAGAPAVAAAQSAGDDQYVDPFAGQDAGGGGGSSGGQSGSSPSASAPSASAPSSSAPSSSAPSSSATAPAASPPPATTAPVSTQLPYTGTATALRALLGAVLLLAGVALRLRVPDVPRRR